MTVRPGAILARLAHLGRILVQLERLRALSPEQRTSDPLHELAAERALHVAAEAIFDVGHHVLAGRNLPVPATYREIVPSLVKAGVFPPALGERLTGMAGLRNILVHDYVSVDAAQVWAAIEDHLDDLLAAQAAFASLPELGREGG